MKFLPKYKQTNKPSLFDNKKKTKKNLLKFEINRETKKMVQGELSNAGPAAPPSSSSQQQHHHQTPTAAKIYENLNNVQNGGAGAGNNNNVTSSADPNSEKKKKVGNYIISKTIGEGSFAKVRLGYHLITQQMVHFFITN